MSVEDDLTIMSSWAPNAYDCFDLEFDELQQLQQRHEQESVQVQRSVEARCRAEVEDQLQREFPDAFPYTHHSSSPSRSGNVSRSSTPAPGSPSARVVNTSKRPKSKHAQQQLQSEMAVIAAKREVLLHQQMQEAMVTLQRQPARQLAAQYAEQLSRTRQSVEVHLEQEARELRRFCSKPLGSYALGEVLEVPTVADAFMTSPAAAAAPGARESSSVSPASFSSQRPRVASLKRGEGNTASMHRVVSERSLAVGSSTGSQRQAKKGGRDGKVTGLDGSTARPHGVRNARSSSTAAGQGGRATEAESTTSAPPPPPPYLIDAHEFAVEYNEMLRREYGYRPAMKNTVAADEVHREGHDSTDKVETLKDRLRTHTPGLTSKPRAAGEGRTSSDQWLPSAQGSAAPTARLPPLLESAHTDLRDRGAASLELPRSFPLPRRASPSLRETTTYGNGGRSASPATVGGRGGGARSRNASPSPAARTLDGIQCSVKGGSVCLTTCAGVPCKQVIRFVNRNAYRTRLRLKAASHPWLTYRCIRVAPAAGSATASSCNVSMEAPLNSGGFVEVEVIFCPDSIEASTARLTATLEMGVAREMNDRTGEGAQWQFLSVPVEGHVALPHFEWWRHRSVGGVGVVTSSLGTDRLVLDASSQVVADIPATEASTIADGGVAAPLLTPHETLLTHAERLGMGDAEVALGFTGGFAFGEALLLASICQTLYLENVGSTAVVHIVSSSPEFMVSLPSESAIELPPQHALPLCVTFCPLMEGPCVATLTVAVRASMATDSPVLTEHMTELRGVGVVPRISIASLGPQLVQQRTVPQWCLSEGEAPLHLILKDTVPGVPTEVPVTVRNDCAVPLPYHWQGDNPGETEEGGVGTTSVISPSRGVLPPMCTIAFTLTVTACTLQPLQTLYNLFIDDMPDPAAAHNVEKLPFLDAEVLEFYRRSRRIPCTMLTDTDEGEAVMGSGRCCCGVGEAGETLPPLERLQVSYLDPIYAFTRWRSTHEDGANNENARVITNAVFASAFMTYQQPHLPSITVDPPVLEERVECLIQTRTTRTVSLRNDSPIALHFLLDPTEAEFTWSVQHCEGPGGVSAMDAIPITYERWRSSFPASDGISVQCQPRKGVIPPHAAVSITVNFSLEACGPHYAVVPCWIPEVELLCAQFSAPCVTNAVLLQRTSLSQVTTSRSVSLPPAAGAKGRVASGGEAVSPLCPTRPSAPNGVGGSVAKRRVGSATPTVTTNSFYPASTTNPEDATLHMTEEMGYYALCITATGVGPTVKTSAELLDFGLIELGQEAAASFTVSNPNPIPVVFDLCDPLMRHPPRFVFIPESFRLGAGNTVEVTVYRKAVSTEDAQTFFELAVRDGGVSVAVETRATIQQPLLVVEDPVVQFGVVPDNVWQSGAFHVSNRSALDTAFTVVPAMPAPSCMEMEYQTEFTVRAGEQLRVPLRCRFHLFTSSPSVLSNGCETSASLMSSTEQMSADAAAGKERCSSLLGVVSKRSRQALLVEVRCEAVEPLTVSVDVVPEEVTNVDDLSHADGGMTTEAYVRALLLNLLERAVGEKSASAGSRSDPLGSVTNTGDGAVAARLRRTANPYCTVVRISDCMSDDVPLSRRSLTVVLQNYTGCEAHYEALARFFTPLPMEATGMRVIPHGTHKRGGKGSLPGASGRTSVQRSQGSSGGGDRLTAPWQVPLQGGLMEGCELLLQQSAAGMHSCDGTEVSDVPAFWITTVQNGATAQQQVRQLLTAAQEFLGDGRQCVTLLGSYTGNLGPYSRVLLPVNLVCALPGRYVEQLRVRADATLPWLHLPIEYEVYGKPILLDGTTSGLTKEGGKDGKEVLLMPPVIAPLGTSRRTIRLVNRVSRDMDVVVEVFPCPLGLAVHAVDPEVPADRVELKLCPMTTEDLEKERYRVGCLTATPFQLRIPAHSRREVVLEFTPALHLSEELEKMAGEGTEAGTSSRRRPTRGRAEKRPGSLDLGTSPGPAAAADDGDEGDDEEEVGAMLPPSEHWWQGSVCIHATWAQSELNDEFLVDEFYALYADRYPTRRVARPISGVAASAATSAGSTGKAILSVAQLSVMRPLRTRPGGRVVRSSHIVWPTETEQRMLDRAAAQGEAATSEAIAGSARGNDCSSTSYQTGDDAADGDDTSSSGGMSVASHRQDAIPPLEVLQREAEERKALLNYMEDRRQMLKEESCRYFTSIELRLRARCGRPHLTIEPSERCVYFPAVQYLDRQTTTASAVVAATSPACMRTIRFTNRNSSPLRFTLSLTPSGGARDGVKADLFSIVRCSHWRSGHDAAMEVYSAVPALPGSAANRAPVLLLDSMDALDVQVLACTDSPAWLQESYAVTTSLRCAGAATAAVEGTLKVQFLSSTQPVDHTTGDTNEEMAEMPCQILPLRVPLTTPSIECMPGIVWFRPGQQRHDGRPQFSYAQSFTLYNRSIAPVSFTIRPVAKGDHAALSTFRHQQASQLQSMGGSDSAVFSPAVTEQLVLANTTTTQLGVAASRRACDSLPRKVTAVVEMPTEAPPAQGHPTLLYTNDSARFTVTPLTGCVPAATRGGVPGQLPICVTFCAFSNVRYESLFEIVVEGAATVPPTYVLLRGDSRDTEV